MAREDINFNQIGGGCGLQAGVYTAYSYKGNKIEIEAKDYMGDWKYVIPDGSLVYINNEKNGDGCGVYATYDNGQLKQILGR